MLQLEQKIQHLNQVDADVVAENSRLQEVQYKHIESKPIKVSLSHQKVFFPRHTHASLKAKSYLCIYFYF